MSESYYSTVYLTVSCIRQEARILYPFDPLVELPIYFPNITLIKYSSLSFEDQLIAIKTHPYGFSIKGVKTGKMQIYYNDANQCIERQRFTITHELGHLLLNHTGCLETTNFEERCADCFARNILSPVDIIEKNEIPLSVCDISQYFGISLSAAQVRLNLYHIDKINTITPIYPTIYTPIYV